MKTGFEYLVEAAKHSSNPLAMLTEGNKVLVVNYPRLFKACEPRRVLPLNGYASSKHVAGMMCAQLACVPEQDQANTMETVSNHTATGLDYLLLTHDVPMFYCREHFIESVAQTNLPPEFMGTDLKWPHPAMLFMLPIAWSIRFFGYPVPWLQVGTLAEDLPCPIQDAIDYKMPVIATTAPRLLMQQAVFIGGYPVTYTLAWPLGKLIKDIETPGDFRDYCQNQDVAKLLVNANRPTYEEEKIMVARMNALTLKILLACTARPEMVERGELDRPRKERRGVVIQDALWSPNIIGRRFTTTHEHGIGNPDGTHMKPHWRRGHFRNQHFGKLNAQTKVIWIEPVLVNAAELETTKG